MSDEEVLGRTIPEGTPDSEFVEGDYSVEEQKAIDHGWVPQEQWQGEDEAWVSAKEFNRRGELFGKINNQNRKINELTTAMKRMHAMMVDNSENAYKQALQQLSEQRNQALTDGDTDQVIQIEKKAKEVLGGMEETKMRMAKEQPIRETPAYFDEWMERNPWYNQDEDKTAYANAVAQQFTNKVQARGGQVDHQQLLNEITTKVNKVFGKTQNKTPDVLGGATTRGGDTNSMASKGKGISSLRPDEQQIARTIIQSTGMSEKDYMKSYNSIKQR